MAILAAVEARNRTGKGQRIEVSQFEVGVNFAGPSLLDFFANGTGATALGNKLPYDQAAPHNVYRCAPLEAKQTADERWIAIACMTDEHWRNLIVVMGDPDWAARDAYDTVQGRLADAQTIDKKISQWTATQDGYELMEKCQAAGVPAGVVQNGRDLVERDPQLKARQFATPIDDLHPVIGQTWADRLPLQFEDMPCESYQRVRLLGEDNSAILHDWLGMDEDTVAKHEREGVLK